MQSAKPVQPRRAAVSPGTGEAGRPRPSLVAPAGACAARQALSSARRPAVRADPLSAGHAATHRGGGRARVVHRQGLRPVYDWPGPIRHPGARHSRLRQADDQQPLSQVPLPVRDHRAGEQGASGHRRDEFGRRQFSPELGPPDPRPASDRPEPRSTACRLSLYWIPDANQTQSTAFAGTGTTLPGFSNFPTNYFTASGALAPPPGSPGSLGPPTSVDNWNMGLGIATFKYVPDRHPVAGSLGSGTVIVVLRGLLNYSGAQSQNDQQYQLSDYLSSDLGSASMLRSRTCADGSPAFVASIARTTGLFPVLTARAVAPSR